MVLNKRIYRIGLAIFLALPIFVSSSWAQGDCKLHKREHKTVQKLFGETVKILPESAAAESLSENENYRSGDCLYRITDREEIRGYLISTRTKGRYDYFDYCVIFTQNLIVRKVLVTVYRSTHGAAICQKNWLSQFEGYQGGPLELGPDIDAVSGATLSATSLVRDIHRTHLLLSSLYAE
jgi:Na+-translocating ferredoxin:NAD+ oxidoreductase RnfG subunit